jgi:hypothetical protein
MNSLKDSLSVDSVSLSCIQKPVSNSLKRSGVLGESRQFVTEALSNKGYFNVNNSVSQRVDIFIGFDNLYHWEQLQDPEQAKKMAADCARDIATYSEALERIQANVEPEEAVQLLK